MLIKLNFLAHGIKSLHSYHFFTLYLQWEDNVLNRFKVTSCDESLFEISEIDTINV